MRAGERAYSTLRAEIVSWALAPGTVLGEVEQAERLGISRTPLREALARLTADGLAKPHRGRGVVVSDVSWEEVAAIFELRHALECKAASLAAKRNTGTVFSALHGDFVASTNTLASEPRDLDYYALVHRFDAAIDEAMENSYLLQALKSLRVHLVRLRQLAKDDPKRLVASSQEHATIAYAITHGHTELAAAATSVHLHNSLQYLSGKIHFKISS